MRHPISKVVLAEFKTRRDTLTEFLTANAGLQPLEDRFKAGYIAAVNDLFQVDIEEIEVD